MNDDQKIDILGGGAMALCFVVPSLRRFAWAPAAGAAMFYASRGRTMHAVVASAAAGVAYAFLSPPPSDEAPAPGRLPSPNTTLPQNMAGLRSPRYDCPTCRNYAYHDRQRPVRLGRTLHHPGCSRVGR